MNKREKYIIGVDIGGTNIRIGASRQHGTLEKFQKIYSKSILNGKDSVENLIRFLKEYIANQLGGAAVEAVALGFPSTLNKERNVIIQTPNISGLDNIPLGNLLKKALGCSIFLERDVNMLFCNDMKNHHLDPEGINVGIYVGTGIGNAIFIDGEPYAGKDGAAGELGHIPTGIGKEKCGCGNEGCSECYASGKYLVELRNTYFADTEIGKLFAEHEEHPKMKEFIDRMAGVIAAEINILNPENIVLGGGVISMEAFPKKYLEEAIHRYTRKPYPEKSLKFFYSMDAAENGVKGAIEYARRQITTGQKQEDYHTVQKQDMSA